MSAAQNGTMNILGRSGKTYLIDIYSPDAAATQWTFNSTGAAAATSPTQLRIPEDGNIIDVSIATGTACAGVVFTQDNAQILGGVVRYANVLNTLANRGTSRIPVRGGAFLGGTTI